MKTFYNKLCLSLLEEHFGLVVKQIGNSLLHEAKTIRTICYHANLPEKKVKEGLCVLIKYGYVTYHNSENFIEYILDPEKVIMILRYSRYILFAKTHCGDEGEIMLEEILKHGYITATEAIIKTYKRMKGTPAKFTKEVSLESLKNTFELLVKNQFLMRSLSFDIAMATEKPNYDVPKLNIQNIYHIMQGNKVDPEDSKIYWKINVDRFAQDFRDQIIISAMTQRFDENAGKLMQQLIYLMYVRTASWEGTSNPIPYTEIKEAVRKLDHPKLEQYLDQYLQLMEEDSSQFIKRVGDSGGGQYCVNMKNAFEQLAYVVVENIIMEKCGSKAKRIFRLVCKNNGITVDQIQQLAMIPAKDIKSLTYLLMHQNYVQTQEQKLIGWSVKPVRELRFYVNKNIIFKMVLEHSCQAVYNLMQKRNHVTISNKRMIDKQLRVQALSANMKKHGATEQQLADIADMMTPSEIEQFEKAQKTIKRLVASELYVDETLFLLTMYFRYH